jgi:tRNA-specific 2-thiouridylase
MINREVLSSLIFPLSEFNKDRTRQLAGQFGLGNAERAESQEICFIPNDDYVAVLEQLAPQLVKEGNIIDSSGNVLGQHQGTHRYTIGQRRGLRVAMGKPWYVTKLDAENNIVTLGPADEVLSSKLTVSNINWLMDRPDKSFKASVKIRYNDKGKPATIYPEGDKIHIEFDAPVKAVTPGQAAVIYIRQNNMQRVAAGAWID